MISHLIQVFIVYSYFCWYVATNINLTASWRLHYEKITGMFLSLSSLCQCISMVGFVEWGMLRKSLHAVLYKYEHFFFSFSLFVYCSLDGQLLFFQLEFVSMNKFRFTCTKQVIDLVSAVKELHGLTSQELGKLLRDSENFTIHYVTEKESLLKVSHHRMLLLSCYAFVSFLWTWHF